MVNRILLWTFDDAKDLEIAKTNQWWAKAVVECPQIELSMGAMMVLEEQGERASEMIESIGRDSCKGK